MFAIGLVANTQRISAEPAHSKVVLANGTTTVVNNYYNNGYSWLPFYYWMFAPTPYSYGPGMYYGGSNNYDYYGQRVQTITPEPTIGTDVSTESPDTLGHALSTNPSENPPALTGTGGKDVSGENPDTQSGGSSSSSSNPSDTSSGASSGSSSDSSSSSSDTSSSSGGDSGGTGGGDLGGGGGDTGGGGGGD